MIKHDIRTRVIIVSVAPTILIGLLLTLFFASMRYYQLEKQVLSAGSNILESVTINAEHALKNQDRESAREYLVQLHRRQSELVRSIAIFDRNHKLFVTSNFHPDFDRLTFPKDHPIPLEATTSTINHNTLVIKLPILRDTWNNSTSEAVSAVGYLSLELDLSSLRLKQYQELISTFFVLLVGILLASFFAYRLMRDITLPITHMRSVVDRIRRGYLDVRIEGEMYGELDSLKNGINSMAASLSEYHLEMQNNIDQATSDLRETLEQLEIQNIELDIAKKRAQEAARIKSEFLANMSHELRTPLNGVIGFTRQILKTPLKPNQADHLRTIEKSAHKLLAIINDILDFSKLEANKMALESADFHLSETLEEVLLLQAPSAHEKRIELSLYIDPNIPPYLIGDSLRIQQIVTNLVGNSIKFTEVGNIDIFIELEQIGTQKVQLKFTIKDTGIGISKSQQADLFQAFSQADASISRRYGGTGLGLVITQRLISQMGGKIQLRSQINEGSTFWFSIDLDISLNAYHNQLDIENLQGQSVLLIDQNPRSAASLQKTLHHTQAELVVRNQMPDESEVCCYQHIIFNVDLHIEDVGQYLHQVIPTLQHCSSNIVIALPTTAMALADEIQQTYNLKTLLKPLAFNRLIDCLQTPLKQLEPQEEIEEVQEIKLPLHILAVDDNQANLKLISALLGEMVEMTSLAKNGLEATEITEKHAFDLIFMDVQMPVMDGVSAARIIKEKYPALPIIAVTAHAMEGERERLLQAGMDDYLTKPIDEAMLKELLHKWTNSPLPSNTNTPSKEKEPTVNNQQSAPVINVVNYSGSQTLDWAAALKQAANKPALAQEMLQMLIDSFDEVEKALQQTFDAPLQDTQTFIDAIHRLHGSSAYCGVPRLKSLCRDIEGGLRGGASIQDIEPELFELEEELEKVKEAAKAYIDMG
ncbi:two-component sensor histidine kinase BarA [Vibrio sp.]|nr:two-component sensor histidine kinase BarA [Vibrio sp.]